MITRKLMCSKGKGVLEREGFTDSESDPLLLPLRPHAFAAAGLHFFASASFGGEKTRGRIL